MLRGTLLTLHLLGVVVWLGAGLYELFLDREMRRVRGQPAELSLARVYTRYGPVVAAHPEGSVQLSEEARALFARVRPYVLLMRAAALLAVVFAVFRPGASAA